MVYRCKSKYLSILVLEGIYFFVACMFVLKEHNIRTSGIGYEIRAYLLFTCLLRGSK